MKISKPTYFIIALAILIFIGAEWQIKKSQPEFTADQNSIQDNQTSWRCLQEDEIMDYTLKEIGRLSLGGILTVEITKNNNIDSFKIDNIRHSYHPVEFNKCGIYVIKLFGYDFNKTKQGPESKSELWRYDYNGKGLKIFLVDEINKDNIFSSFYSTDFRVDSNEHYIVLQQGYLGKEDYALIIKDLNTKQDIFTLSYQGVFEENPQFLGAFGMRAWSTDGRYFWADIFEAAQVHGFVRIDSKNWQYELYPVPQGLMAGEKLNAQTGWVTYHTDLVWSGVQDVQEEIKAARRQQGIGTKFYLYNLLNQKQILIYETREPLFFTQPEWVSDNQIEYTLDNGEKKIFKL